MPQPERRPTSRISGEHPRPVVAHSPELSAFLHGQDLAALLHASDAGTVIVVKAPELELRTLGGPVPIGLVHELYDHPYSPVVRSVLTIHDRPETPLRLETFTNVGDPDQRADFAALADQDEIALLLYDERLRHRLSKRVRNASADELPRLLTTADRLLAAVPPGLRDFDRAKTDVMGVTRL